MKRRARQSDPLSNPAKVLDILRLLAEHLKMEVVDEAHLIKLAFALQHFRKYSLKTLRTGRRGRFDRSLLHKASGLLEEILVRETASRISVSRFLSRYVPLVQLPIDLYQALEKELITVEEAHLLARLSAKNLKGDKTRASRLRADLLAQHVKYGFSQTKLRVRVRETLGESIVPTTGEMSAGIQMEVNEIDSLLEINPYDTTHLLFEEIKNLVYLVREVDEADLDEGLAEEILDCVGACQFSLHKAINRKTNRLSAQLTQ